MVSDKLQEFIEFLGEYADFLESMIPEQNDKLEALLSHDVPTIERSVARQQVLSIRMEQMEQGREKRQQEIGFPEKTLKEIAESVRTESPEQAQKILDCHERMSRAVEQIKFLNEKAMHLVETNLQLVNMEVPAETQTQLYTERAKKIAGGANPSIYEKKI